jgi:hypothetical protein
LHELYKGHDGQKQQINNSIEKMRQTNDIVNAIMNAKLSQIQIVSNAQTLTANKLFLSF